MPINEFFLNFQQLVIVKATQRLLTKMSAEKAFEQIQNADWSAYDSLIEEETDFSNIQSMTPIVSNLFDYRLFVTKDDDNMLFLHWVPEIIPSMVVVNDILFPVPEVLRAINAGIDWPSRWYDLATEIEERNDIVVHVEPLNMSAIRQPAVELEEGETIDLHCAICGRDETVSTDDHGDWMPDVYLGDTEIGTVCPYCMSYCEVDPEDGYAEVRLNKVSWPEASELLVTILKRFQRPEV